MIDTFDKCSIDMTQDEKDFFQTLGARVAQLRKAQGITQVQLGAQLGIAQQMVTSYETGRRRIPASLLPRLAYVLAVPIETLLGVPDGGPAKRGPAPRLQQQLERLSRLPKAQQKVVMQMLDGVLAQAGR